ncbi:uncharacterized protein [Argopecten irradians]|uniref:uncharacterized protein n=1 Tax=Argopecten irradians TaxID=31199 RepID=UPI0037247825
MSRLLGCIEHEVELLMERFDDILDSIEANSIVDRLKGMREAMDGILKYILNKSGYERIPELPKLKTGSKMIYERTAMEAEPLPEQSINHEVIVELNPNEELTYRCPEDQQRVITFPAGTVDSPQKALIKFEPVKENTILLTEVAGFSDTICIHHEEKFLKPVRIEIPLKSMEEDDFRECELYCVTIGDEMTINEDVHVTLLSDNVCSFETIDFSKKGAYAKYSKKKVPNSKNVKENMEKFSKEIKQLHGHGPYNILIFIGTGYQEDTWRLHVEVAHEKDIKDTITKRRNGMNLIELSRSRSPNVNIKEVEKIEVTLGQKGPLALCWKRRYFIEVIPGGHSIFVAIPVRRINKDNMATIHCKAVKKTSNTSMAKPKGNIRNTKGNDYLYTAHFDPRNMSICKPQPIVSDVGSPFAQNITPDTNGGFNRPTSRTRTTLTPSSSLSSIETSQQAANINFFGDKSMLCLAKQIDLNKMWEVAVNLEIPDTKYKDFEQVYKDSPNKLKTNLLMYWHENQSCPDREKVSLLCSALEEAELTLTADTVQQVFNKNRPLEKKDFQN